jgi:hypothetical protein
MQKILQHQQAEPAPIGSFREDVPDEAIAILRRMLAKNPEERYQIPAAVAVDLTPLTRVDPNSHDSLRRKLAAFKPQSSALGKDHTPLPTSLGSARGQERVLKAGRNRNPGREADTSSP